MAYAILSLFYIFAMVAMFSLIAHLRAIDLSITEEDSPPILNGRRPENEVATHR